MRFKILFDINHRKINVISFLFILCNFIRVLTNENTGDARIGSEDETEKKATKTISLQSPIPTNKVSFTITKFHIAIHGFKIRLKSNFNH